MKIGYVLKIFPKISEKFVTNEILELIKMGHEIYIFSMLHPYKKIIYHEKIMHDEVLEYGLLKRTYYSPYIQRVILELSGYTSLALGHHPNNVLYNRLCSDIANSFVKIIKNRGIALDIIHVHFATEQALVAMKMSRMLGIPFTIMAHANDIFINPDVRTLKEKFESVSAIMTPSYYNKEYIHNLTKISKDRISIIRACPNIDELREIKKKENGLNVLSISRLVDKKGIKYGILAIKEIIEDYPEITYKIVGTGPLEKELKSLIASLNLCDNVKITGNLDNYSLNDEFSRTTIFMMPCIKSRNGDMDGIPVSLMEAMYLQIPVVSTTISGIPELIDNNINGLLVEPNNVIQLTEAIRSLLINKDLRNKIGNNGKEKIENDFNIHEETKKLVGIWNQIKFIAK